MMLLQNANFIKTKVIDFIIKNKPDSLIGNEVQFGSNRGFADLVVISNNLVIGYEIKAAGDDLRNLKNQLKLYKYVFDYVYTVVTEKHIDVAKQLINSNSGLILITSNGELEFIVSAILITKNKKDELLSSMTIKFLKDYFGVKGISNSYKIRNMLRDNTLKEIKMAYNFFLKERLTPKNKLFFSEFGINTHFEDVKLLSFNENSELL